MRSLSVKSLRVRWCAIAVAAAMLCGCPSGNRLELKPEVSASDGVESEAEAGADAQGMPSSDAAAEDAAAGTHGIRHGVGMMPPESAAPVDPLVEARRGTWSTRRLVGLAPAGPLVLDLSVSVDGASLEGAADAALTRVVDEILSGLAAPVTWEALLEQPLVRSGWLGNIVADDEQQVELISLYDANADGLVEAGELRPFLTRGLPRGGPLTVVEGGAETGAATFASPWGIADLNNDNTLDASELAQLVVSLGALDSNGDTTITLAEVTENQAAQAEGMMSVASRLSIDSVVIAQPQSTTGDEPAAARERRRTISSLMRHYTFLETIPREQWPAWSDTAWSKLDNNMDQAIDSREALGLLAGEAPATLYVRLPALTLAGGTSTSGVPQPPPWLVAAALDDSASWKAHAAGGRLTTPSCSVGVRIHDGFDRIAQMQLRRLLGLALGNSQLKLALTEQLQLGDWAFDVLDSDGDQQLSDAEFARLWNWLTVRQGAQTVARWTLSSHPWFQLGDSDGDGRLTERELSHMRGVLERCDRDSDGQLTPYELPLLVTLEITRSDSRLSSFQGRGEVSATENSAGGWFSAMDTNGDGVLSRQEFMGSKTDFEHLDVDKDGFVAAGEVYLAP